MRSHRFILLLACSLPALAQPVRYLSWSDAREVTGLFASSGLPGSDVRDATAWDRWIRSRDRVVRRRVDRGIEDSISNLVLYGTSYTRLPRLPGWEAAVTSGGKLTPAARARLQALAGALRKPGDNERLRLVREFLARRGVASEYAEKSLAANLRRFAAEEAEYENRLDTAAETRDAGAILFARGTLYEHRGLSVDTSLLPNMALETTLGALINKKVLAPGSIRRVAIVGPGLDFIDRRDGYDYHPLQTIQPLAVLEAVLRLRLASADTVRIAALDVNPMILEHLRRIEGHPYVVELPRDPSAGWTEQAIRYWQHFGDVIGSPVKPLPAPATLGGLVTRAVSIPPGRLARIEPADLDIVAQTWDNAGFDLVVATNILVYYNRFEQALAMAAIARMMNPGGIFLANCALPAQHPAALEYLGRKGVSYSVKGAFGDDVVVYRRR